VGTPSEPEENPRPKLASYAALAASCLLGAGVGFALSEALQPAEEADVAFYRAVRQIIEDEYVLPVEREELLTSAIEGVVADLDPYSRFYTGEPLARIEHDTRGTFQGIGAVFACPMDDGRVLFPLPGSPAERAGLAVGDQILSFGGTRIVDLQPGEFARELRALEASPIAIEVRRESGELQELTLTPAEVLDPTVRHLTLAEPEIGYLAITSFSRRTLEEFDRAVAELQAAGATSLVIDLRGNPGGVLHAATRIANRFIEAGPLVVTETRHGREETLADPNAATLLGLPLAVLVDAGSASASEVLAGALQDDRRAALVGTATYGKGTVQTLTPLSPPESILKVTTGFYATPSGRSIDRHYRSDGGSAIWPDIEIELSEKDRAHLHARLADYSPPLALTSAVEALELELGREPSPRLVHDAQLDAALALFTEGS
jgi:carboxyl-terminal processing protease